MSQRSEQDGLAQRGLTADCARCAGLCCVAPAFTASADFAEDKPEGEPCRNLLADFRCGIHDHLRERGFPGCAVFDCFGAGQQVTQNTFDGRSWRTDPALAPQMFAVFRVMRQLHELLWHLDEARELCAPGPMRAALDQTRERIERLTRAGADELEEFEIGPYRQEIGVLLGRVSEDVRARERDRLPDRRGADLIGANLQAADLRAASLRGSYLIGARLRGADLRRADLLGADLRAADLRGARLDGALFLTQPQVDAATGDEATTLTTALTRPAHWQRAAQTP